VESVKKIVAQAQTDLKKRVDYLTEQQGKFEIDQYTRFLTMQHFLTKNVLKEFYDAAGHGDLYNRKSLRQFLVKFGEEEEPHPALATEDAKNLGREIGDRPIDVVLWKTYFEKTIKERPFIRIGATCVLENIADPSTSDILKLLENTPELNESNTQFIRLHMHDADLPHGDEIYEALESVELSADEIADLEFGARIGRKIYVQFADWIISGEELNGLSKL